MNEAPLLFGASGQRLFGVLHRPEKNNSRCSIVFCHPFAEEKLWAHRVFVAFARELAAIGYTVLRFDYRGYGDSDREFSDVTADDHLDDLRSAIRFIHDVADSANHVGLLGYRLGANLALRGARELGTSGPLILWDPILDPQSYLQDFLRSNLTTQLAVYGKVQETREHLLEKMRSGESINVEGYELTQAQYNSIRALEPLAGSVEAAQASTLVVQVGQVAKERPDYATFAQHLGASFISVAERPFWREIKHFYYRADNLFAATLEWMGTDQ